MLCAQRLCLCRQTQKYTTTLALARPHVRLYSNKTPNHDNAKHTTNTNDATNAGNTNTFRYQPPYARRQTQQQDAEILQVPQHDEGGEFTVVGVDRSGLYKTTPLPKTATAETEVGGAPMSELGKEFRDKILMRGPVSVGEWMRACLLHPTSGYYTRQGAPIFGQSGDFITSPEISQLFGESLAIWCISVWQQMGEPNSINIVELGPGRGTLAKDFCRVAAKFPQFQKAVLLSLVEPSAALRATQATALQCSLDGLDDPMKSKSVLTCGRGTRVEWHGNFESYSGFETIPLQTAANSTAVDNPDQPKEKQAITTKQAPPCIIIAHELFDALPTHQFQLTNKGWAERYVDIEVAENADNVFRHVLLPQSPMCFVLEQRGVLDKTKTPVGDGVVEYSPDAEQLMHQICLRVSKSGGAALIIDYSAMQHQTDATKNPESKPNHPTATWRPHGSIRGIQNHKFVSELCSPGCVDISADVDFDFLAAVASRYSNCRVHGPTEQQHFLTQMGIDVRLDKLLDACENDEKRDELEDACWRLLDPEEMGQVYKFMAITHSVPSDVAGFMPMPAEE